MTDTALQFDKAEHVYSLDGKTIPSVTAILSDVGIIDYSAIPDGVRVAAMERGRHVHSACEFYDQADLGDYNIALDGYLEAWKKFRNEMNFRPSLIEHRASHPVYGYAGTLDRTGLIESYGEVVLDIKTSVVPYWAKYQLAAYANFFDQPTMLRRMAVALRYDGQYRIQEYRCSDTRADFDVFLAALSVYNAKRAMK